MKPLLDRILSSRQFGQPVVRIPKTWFSSWQRSHKPQDDQEVLQQIACPIEIIEHPDSYTVRADVPGADRIDVDVNRENVLTLSGEKRKVLPEQAKVRYTERTYGMYCRSVTLPTDADRSRMQVSQHNGQLVVHLPKSQGDRSPMEAIPVEIRLPSATPMPMAVA